MSTIRPLWEHQSEMVDFALTKNGRKTILNADMGLGKTLATIETIERFGSQRVLVVCPPRVIRFWSYQADVWNLGMDLLPLDQSGTKARLKAFDPNFNGVVVTNYQGFWREGLYEALLKWSPQVLVFDEALHDGLGRPAADRFGAARLEAVQARGYPGKAG